MALSPGTRLGVYDVGARLGAGGMGEVFRARDTTLNRDVALKILPDAFASDPDRLARFTREAQTLASLNHPNIAHIHGLEASGGVRALVMELVDGDDLSRRIARGAIPLDEALPIAKQIAEALEAAHEQGIVHRDLKPANIKVRADGTVKVLDFGLAKAMDQGSGIRDQGSAGVSMSPTLTSPAMMTGVGMILGTAAYMAPEQAKGRAVDKRADIWAFGVVLYEMLTGRRLFDAEDLSETLAAVLTRDVSLTTLPAAIPARVRAMLRDCLIRDPRQRLRDIGDARIAIEQIIAGAVDIANLQSPVPHPRLDWQQTLLVAAAAAALAAATVLSLWAPWRAVTPADRPLARLDVDLGADVALPTPTTAGSSVAVSPDGTRIVYASGTPAKLFIRRLDQSKAIALPGTQGATAPIFSSDSQWVAFVIGGKTSKISVEGGAVAPLSGNPARDGGWGDDGGILLTRDLRRIPAGDGPPETIAQPVAGGLALGDAQVLPGGKAILFSADYPGPVDRTTIDVITLAGGQRRTVIRGGASPRYLATANGAGHLLYINGATLFAIPFDLNTLETRGTAVPLLDDVAHETLIGVGQYDISRSGTLVYRKAGAGTSALSTLQWLDTAGRKEPLRAKPTGVQDPTVSPDGKRIAVTIGDGTSTDVWVYDPQRDAMMRVTFGGKVYRTPRWSPDGQYLVFAEVGNGLVQARADGASQPQPLTQARTYQIASSFTPDGKRLAYTESTGIGIWTVPIEDRGGQLKAGTPEAFIKGGSNDAFPSFSPDGRWLAYQSDESGAIEVYVRAFPPPASGPGGKWQVSNNGGTVPRWSRGGHDLVYQAGDQILAAAYTVKGDTFVAEKPRVWIATLGAVESANGAAWDLAPDGKRVAVVMPVESAEAPKPEHEVVFLLNFFDELRRRVPLGK